MLNNGLNKLQVWVINLKKQELFQVYKLFRRNEYLDYLDYFQM